MTKDQFTEPDKTLETLFAPYITGPITESFSDNSDINWKSPEDLYRCPLGENLILCRRGDKFTIESVDLEERNGSLLLHSWPNGSFSSKRFDVDSLSAWVKLA